MAQTFCHVCYGTSLTFENGVLVCDACGTQAQVFQEEVEFRDGIDDTRTQRRTRGSTAGAHLSQVTRLAREEQQAAQQLQTAAIAYVRCLQQLLQAQAECLTTKFGVSSQVSSILRQLWLSHLPNTGMLEAKPSQPDGAQLPAQEAGGGADAGADGEADGELPATRQGREQLCSVLVRPESMRHHFYKLLHPQLTLQLCFLACVLLREPITFYDIQGWALDAQLPFLDLQGIANRCLSEAESSALPGRCLEPDISLGPLSFLNSTCQLAEGLGLQLPPVAGEALLMRQVQELGLPQVVLDLSLQLYCMYLIQTPRLQLTPILRVAQVTPDVWLSALVLVAIKMLYGLGDTAGLAPVVPKAPGPLGGWQAWAEAALQRLPGLTHMLLTEQEVLALGPEAQHHYLQYCRSHLFAGHPVVPTFEDIHSTLQGWYEAASAQQQPAGASQGFQGRQQQQQQQPAGAAVVDADTPGFTDYCLATKQVASSHRLEPQLAAVVLVLAGYSRCTHASLMECVLSLEKQVIATEAGASIMRELDSVS